MSTEFIPAPEPEFEQTRVVDVFPLHGFTCAHTTNDSGTVDWWHVFAADGHYLGRTSRPEYVGAVIQQAR
ncbi:hypothetical protein [Kitasatospora sp. MBT63]|uniref:hypothetical protein n=1 Tax=Kitasatospora sp. MBT63 TaxID=1444768 RepID=UPI00053A85FF|nr:hypothetical protein [Kitasatospora sp. MBT63]